MMPSEHERWSDLADREALGEVLSASDLEFLRAHADADPIARAEADLWASLGDLQPSSDELGNRALADAAVRAALAERKSAPVGRRAWLFRTGGAVAAAAAVALFVLGRHPANASVVEYVASGVQAAGAPVAKGALLSPGTEVVAVGGPACVAIEPKIHACLASGSKVRLTEVGAGERRVDLLSGRVAVALFPLPAGERFSIVANGVWSTAVGTAFTVELEASGAVETIVHEGKVAVGAERGADVVGAHKIGLSEGGKTTVEALVSHERTETPEWAALATVAQRSIEAKATTPVVESPAAPAPEAVTEPAAAPEAAATEPALRHVAPPAPKAAPSTPAELLGVARQALRDQRWADAATGYQQIIATFPSTPEAHTVLVPLANLELDRLGQPAGALKHLELYLATGGPLAVEARLAKIKAYRALGKAAEEAHAIDEFLAAHPSSLEADKLRQRREALGTH